MSKGSKKPKVMFENIEQDVSKRKEVAISVSIDNVEVGYIVKNKSGTHFDLLDSPTNAFTLGEMGEIFSKMKEISKK